MTIVFRGNDNCQVALVIWCNFFLPTDWINSNQVAIIGGGVIGTSVLYHLAKLGWHNIALFERKVLTAGSSWHAAGSIHAQRRPANGSTSSVYHQFTAASRRRIRQRYRLAHDRRHNIRQRTRKMAMAASGISHLPNYRHNRLPSDDAKTNSGTMPDN